jgi:hypothetical protein
MIRKMERGGSGGEAVEDKDSREDEEEGCSGNNRARKGWKVGERREGRKERK